MSKNNKLNKFFHPKSIALIGASNHAGKVGYDIMLNLLKNFDGEIYPINLDDKEVQGKKAYPTVTKLKAAPDLVIIVIPAAFVIKAVTECGQKGCKNIVIISAGFKEAGEEGVRLEKQLVDLKKKYKLKILGPNCLGYISTSPEVNASFARSFPPKGKVAFVSQSGALGTAVLDMAEAQQVGLSYFVSLGNKCDLSELDLLLYLKDHTPTKVITMYLENIIAGQKFMALAKEVARKKPIIVLKSGKTEKGQRAVSSHTGSLAGSARAYSTAFSQCGIIEAEDLEDFFNYAEGLAYQPLPAGKRVAVITNAGGPGILVTDLLPPHGLELAELSGVTLKRLKTTLPPAANIHNPVDVLGDAKADRYALAIEAALKDKNVDSLIVVLTPQKMTEIKQTAEAAGRLSRKYKKTTALCFMGEAEITKYYDVYKKYSLPQFNFPLQAVKVLGKMWQYSWQKTQTVSQKTFFKPDKKMINQGNKLLRKKEITEDSAREILARFDFPLHRALLVKNVQPAILAAKKIGYPIALKVVSPQVIHKSEAGGVKINIKSDEELKKAVLEMKEKVLKKYPQAKINGYLVGEMVKGLELIIGMKRDPQFGPLLMVGLGGIYTEVFQDVAFGIAPLQKEAALKMIGSLKIYPIMKGVRGQRAADIEALAEIIVKLSEFSLNYPQIKEIDFNPVILKAKGQGGTIVDLRLLK
ncbi:MAG: acetate--CoA ligase family protein [Patescibacteria group bacterium]